MMQPLVSIIIPVYNRERYIEQTIRCALDQSYPNIEVVVVDNCSTDRSWEIITRIAQHEPKLNIHQNHCNLGPIANWQIGAKLAKGIYGKILWSDDLMAPNFIERCVSVLTNEIGFVFSSVRYIDPISNPLRTDRADFVEGFHLTELFIRQALLTEHWVPVSPGCALFRTADLQAFITTDIPNAIQTDFNGHGIGPDLMLFLKCAEKYSRFYYIKEPLVYFREHVDSISMSTSKVRLKLMYHVTRCAFLSSMSVTDDELIARYNAILLIFYILHCFLIKPKIKFKQLYPSGCQCTRSIDWRYLLNRLYVEINTRIRGKCSC